MRDWRYNKFSPLIYAIRNGYKRIAKLIIAENADVNPKD